MDKIESVPVHEAGHAVIARLLNIPAGDVAVGYDARTGIYGFGLTGEVPYIDEVWQWQRFRSRLSATEARTVVAMAGVAAELEIHGSLCGGQGSDISLVGLDAVSVDQSKGSTGHNVSARDKPFSNGKSRQEIS
jgi:hypothetical protein